MIGFYSESVTGKWNKTRKSTEMDSWWGMDGEWFGGVTNANPSLGVDCM